MIYKPNIVYPYNNAIDGSIDNNFSFDFNGDKLKSYQISIKSLATNEDVYTGEIINPDDIYNMSQVDINIPSGSFANNQDLVWLVKLWEESPTMFVVSGVVLGGTGTSITLRKHPTVKVGMYLRINNEDRVIISYNYETGVAGIESAFTITPTTSSTYQIYTDFITSPSYPFKSRTIPVVTIVDAPNETVTSRIISLHGNYTQAQNVLIKYHQWTIYDIDNNIINQTEETYHSNLRYTFDGLDSEREYFVQLKVVNQDGVEVSTPKHRFAVSYRQPNVTVAPQILPQQELCAMQIKWSSDKQSRGVATDGEGSYEFIADFPFEGTNSVELKSGMIYFSEISESPLHISDQNFGLLTSVRLPESFQGKIIELSNNNGDKYGIRLNNYNFVAYKNNMEYDVLKLYEQIEFMLTASGIPEADTGYSWDDNATWDDITIWTESVSPFLSTKQWKISMTPSQVIVKEGVV